MAQKPVANLDLMAKIAGSWEKTMKKVMSKNKDLRRYMGRGGARIPAVLTRVFPLNEGSNAFNRGFECYLLNTHGAEPVDSEALIQGGMPGSEAIKIVVRYTPKADAPAAPIEMGLAPTEYVLQSRSTQHFQTGEMDALGKIAPGQIVILNGVSARAYVPRGGGNWGIAFDVQFVEPAHNMTLASLYDVSRGTGTSYMLPCDFHYDEAVPSSRYNRSSTHFISVFTPPTSEDARRERLERMLRESGETRLVNDYTDKTFSYKSDGRAPSMKASLDLIHTQWLPGQAENEEWRDVVLLGITLWAEQLTEFGIVDVAAWDSLAPMIFDKLDFKAFGCVDTKGTDTNFGGVEGDKDVAFAIQLSGMGIIADIEGCYRRIGIPITADCVTDLQMIPGGAPGGGMAIKDDEFVNSLSAVVPVTGQGASSPIAGKLLTMARQDDSKIEFCALIKYSPSPAVLKGLATLTPEEGSALVNALASNSDAEILSDAKVHGLYEMMATGKSGAVIGFAFCNGIIPESVKAERNSALITYMTGKAPTGAAAIEAGSAAASAAEPAASAAAPEPAAAAAAAVEELDGDEPTDVDEEDVSETEQASRKRHAKKSDAADAGDKASKRKSKRRRHE